MVRGVSKAAVKDPEAKKRLEANKATKARLEPEGAIYCKLCEMWLWPKQLEAHERGKLHTTNKSVKKKQYEQGYKMNKTNKNNKSLKRIDDPDMVPPGSISGDQGP